MSSGNLNILGRGFLLVENLAKQQIDDFLGESFVARDAGRAACEMVAQVAEHGLRFDGRTRSLRLNSPVLDALAVARNVRQFVIFARASRSGGNA